MITRALVALALLFGLSGAATTARAQAVGVVTDLQGKATLQASTGAKPVAMLLTLQSGDRLDLAADARLSVLYYATGAAYDVQGPGAISVGPTALAASGGAKVDARAAAPGKVVRLKPGGLVQGAVVLRTLGLRLPAPGSTVLDRAPELRWSDTRQSATYRVVLTDAAGKVVHRAETGARALKLPADLELAEGATYQLEITAVVNGADAQRSRSSFTVATAELREQVQALAPASAAAPVPERVAYALWLEQQGLQDEARRWWPDIAQARPDEGVLRSRAAAAR